MNRIDIINSLIQKNGYTRYLEIGVQGGHCFRAINCENKVGVDPDTTSAATRHTFSDAYFNECKLNGVKHDIIFIDGLHHADQVEKDILNSLECLKEGGTIVMHDCLPTSKHMQEIPMRADHDEWTGDTWKAYAKLRAERNDLEMCVVDTDWGCGIIRPGKQEVLLTSIPFTYENFAVNRDIWMNVISIGEFQKRYL